MWLGISELGLCSIHWFFFFFWSLKNLMGAHGVADCRECVVCGGCGFQRLHGKAGSPSGWQSPLSSREGGGLPGVWAFSTQSSRLWRGLRRTAWWHVRPIKSTQKAWLLSTFTRACPGGSGHLELGGMLHRNRHSEDFNPQHVLFIFCKAFS